MARWQTPEAGWGRERRRLIERAGSGCGVLMGVQAAAVVGQVSRAGLSCYIAASNLGTEGRLPRRKPSIRSSVRAIMTSVSGFSSVSCRETWRVPVPRIRDRLHRIEPRSPDGRPRGTSAIPLREPVEGSRTAPPMLVRKTGHSGRSAPCAPAGSSRLRRNRHAVGSQLPARWPAMTKCN